MYIANSYKGIITVTAQTLVQIPC